VKTAELIPETSTTPDALIREARRRQRRRYLVTTVAAALVATAVGVGISQLGPDDRAGRALLRTSAGDGSVDYSSPPLNYAYGVTGSIAQRTTNGERKALDVDGRYVKLRATATGKLLATLSPRPYNDFGMLTADASGRTFVFSAQRHWHRGVPVMALEPKRDEQTPEKFLTVHISPAGGMRRSWLTLPEPLRPAQHPTIALSPDGTRLAVAFGGRGETATVQVIRLATGQVRQWSWPRCPWTPQLAGQGAWTANGRELAFNQQTYAETDSRYATSRLRVLDTTAPGTSLTASRLLVLRAPAGDSVTGVPFLTPDGTKLIGAVAREKARKPWPGELAVYSAQTGALLRTQGSFVWPWKIPPGKGGDPRQTVAWSNRTGSQLIVLQPRDRLNVLGVLTGNSFGSPASKLLPRQPAGYQQLQYSLRIANIMAW
jgi:hypothetical protein